MQYIIMFALCVAAAMADVITGLFKARITVGYDSTIMRKGLYSKAVNLIVMMFFIAVDIGLELLGRYYEHPEIAKWVGGITAGFVCAIIILMEMVSIAENFAECNPKSPIAKAFSKKLKKIQDDVIKKEEDAK